MLRACVTASLTVALLAAPAAAEQPDPQATPTRPQVLAISVDGLNVKAIRQLGTEAAPTLHRMLSEGAGTLNARTELEQTVTLPNHTGMVTGRRIAAARGGHGVTWNDDRPGSTVQAAAGHGVHSVFSVVQAAGGSTALWSTKEKFLLFQRSWPRGVDSATVLENQRRLVSLARADLRDGPPTFTFLHLSLPDRAGHEHGGMSQPYLDAVHRTDTQLGTVLRALAGSRVTVILTADHGFAPGVADHQKRTDPANYRVPFLVWGSGVDAGDLYDLNPVYRDPRGRRPSYAGRQPVRNGDLANLAAGLLGLGTVPGSQFGAAEPLAVRQ